MHCENDELTAVTSYFTHYHYYTPVCDPSMPPDQYYAESPVVFWCICAVASRRYADDPQLMVKLAPLVYELPLKALFCPHVSISAIKGTLLLLSWCFPASQSFDEVPFVFSSALLHAAMKRGLHMPDSSRDFYPFLPPPDEGECAKRFELWVRCYILYIR